MKKIGLLAIAFLLVIVTFTSIAVAESETTYYIQDGNGGWRECTPEEAVYAKYYLNKFNELFPDKVSDRTWGPGLDDYDIFPIPTSPTPTPTPVPTVKPAHVPVTYPDGFWEKVISDGFPKRSSPKITYQFR